MMMTKNTVGESYGKFLDTCAPGAAFCAITLKALGTVTSIASQDIFARADAIAIMLPFLALVDI